VIEAAVVSWIATFGSALIWSSLEPECDYSDCMLVSERLMALDPTVADALGRLPSKVMLKIITQSCLLQLSL
jgi:hypothetical protein